MTFTVCAIIPTFNRAKFAEECLRSVLAQSRPPDEIIVVDDGSTDDTPNVMAEYDGRVRYIQKANGGKSSALNLGLAQTKADLIWVCDDDDLADPEGLARLLDAFSKEPDADFAFGDFRMFRDGPSGREIIAPSYTRRADEPNVKISFLEDMFTFQFAMLVKRIAYERVGPFDETLMRSQDYEMTLRLSRHGRAVYAPKVIFYQRIHEGERGAAHERFSREASDFKWLHYDRIYLTRIVETYVFEEFTPTFALSWDFAARRRATFLQRGASLAWHGVWDLAINDFEAAAIESSKPLTEDERRLCEPVVRKWFVWKALASGSELRRLRDLGRSSKIGREIVFALCRPLGWMTRQTLIKKDYRLAGARVMLMQKILGWPGTVRRFWCNFRSP